MQYLILALKGMLFGVANLIPGVSGGTIAVITGVYEKLLDAINNLFKKFKTSIIFLGVYGIGALIAILGGAMTLDWLLENLELPTSLFFMGLIIGSFGTIRKPVKGKLKWYHYLIMLACFGVVVGLLFIPFGSGTVGNLKVYEYFILALCGFLASVAMVIPGISGMMMFYLFGYYDVLMSAFSGLTSMSSIGSSILVLLPIIIGIVIGIFTAAKVISILLEKFTVGTYAGIIGFVIGSIFALAYNGGLLDDLVKIFNNFNYLNKYDVIIIFGNHIYFEHYLLVSLSLVMIFLGMFLSALLSTYPERKAEKEALRKQQEEEKKALEAEKEEKRLEMKQKLMEELGYQEPINNEEDTE